jgi:hypothetical protein
MTSGHDEATPLSASSAERLKLQLHAAPAQTARPDSAVKPMRRTCTLQKRPRLANLIALACTLDDLDDRPRHL